MSYYDNDLFKKDSKTNHYGKTRIYNIKKNLQFTTIEDSPEAPPYYKIILNQYHLKYLAEMDAKGTKPLSFNYMKLKYGLPNNLDHYFIINPKHESFKKPKSIHQKNAYILIIFYKMSLEHANLFLESLNYPRLDSPLASNLTKCIRYALSCSYTLEEVNQLLSDSKIETLF
ncbi:hypothetical protein [Vallitalea okinawensis]|uniref:hypothetical protein n=1 Tax=Vallitalea okinawensis TaxID=2078660 RepID=UPI000CFC3AC6|nr:hypothetical protein [Vallitalea okinawensis]